MTEPALRVTGFSFSLKGKDILQNLSFSVLPGERIAVIGPNGAGKTTLLKCLNRILKGGRGEIRIAGRPLESFRQFDLAKRVGYVPQTDGRSAPYSVREIVEMARYPHLGPLAPMSREDAAVIDRALSDTGMGALSDRPLETLSGGECQKALLAAALAQESDLLLLDEPTAFLDPSQRSDLLAVLDRVHRERGSTILSVTHDLNEALASSERVIALRGGALVFDGPAMQLIQGDTLHRIYRHGFVVGEHPRSRRPVVFAE